MAPPTTDFLPRRLVCVQLDDDRYRCSADESELWIDAPRYKPKEARARAEKRDGIQLALYYVWMFGGMFLLNRAHGSKLVTAACVVWFFVGLAAMSLWGIACTFWDSKEVDAVSFKTIFLDVAGLHIGDTVVPFDAMLAYHADGQAVVIDLVNLRCSIRLEWSTLAEAEAFARRIDSVRREYVALREGRAYRFARGA